MCLAVLEWSPESDFPLIAVANRDEFRARPTAPMRWWENATILAGQDLEAGGTWLGLNKQRKFALLTNIRPGFVGVKGELSRGQLVSDYLSSNQTIETYHQTIAKNIDRYAGFNLILSDGERLFWFSSTNSRGTWLKPGIHALSNDSLNTPWPKLLMAKQQIAEQRHLLISTLTKHTILQSPIRAKNEELPDTGVPIEWEQKLSAQTIDGTDYGTRCRSHIVIRRQNQVQVAEQQIDENGNIVATQQFAFS